MANKDSWRSMPYPLEGLPKARKQSAAPIPTETSVSKAIMLYLEADWRVSEVWRVNAGGLKDQTGRLVWFARYADNKPVKFLDIGGRLRDGRHFEIECKRRLPAPETVAKWRALTPEKRHKDAKRYLEQEQRVTSLLADGCPAGIVDSVDGAREIIDAAFRFQPNRKPVT